MNDIVCLRITGKGFDVPFYGISPTVKVIPKGMKLFRIVRSDEYPYRIMSVDIVRNRSLVKNMVSTHFIAYNEKVENTVPLYFHKLGRFIVPSFKESSPTSDNRWVLVNTAYVMSYDTFKNKGEIKFKCEEDMCIPSKEGKVLSAIKPAMTITQKITTDPYWYVPILGIVLVVSILFITVSNMKIN